MNWTTDYALEKKKGYIPLHYCISLHYYCIPIQQEQQQQATHILFFNHIIITVQNVF